MDSPVYPPPRLIFWETTAGCNLECIHCRRMTVADQLLPQDLTTEESYDLIDQIAAFARPIFVLSGGEPLFRPDIYDIARHASDAGLIVALATNGTLIDAEVARQIKASGVRRPTRPPTIPSAGRGPLTKRWPGWPTCVRWVCLTRSTPR